MNKALLFIFITVLLDVIGIGIIIPILPSLIQELTQTNVSKAAGYAAGLITTYSVMQLIFSPIIGGLSDQYGRRPVLLLALLGFGLDYILLALSTSIMWLFIGRMIAGIFGASFTTAGAYIADISEPEKRAQNFGILGAAFGIGFIIGPALGGMMAGFGLRAPFWMSAALTLLNALYGYFILPESLKRENRRKFSFKEANPIGSIVKFSKYPVVAALLFCIFLLYMSNFATQGTWSFYTIERFAWTEWEVGLSLGFIGVMVAIVQGGAIRPIIKKLGQSKTLLIGLSLNFLGLFLFAIANEGWQMYAIVALYSFGGLAGPAFQGILSTVVPPNEQGMLQGALTSLNSLAAILGQPLMLGLFSYFTAENTIYYLPTAPFIMGTILIGITFFLTRNTLKVSTKK